MKNKNTVQMFGLLLLASSMAAAGPSGGAISPCGDSGKRLRKDSGDIARFSSEEMKSRAIHKVDVSHFMRRTDIKGIAILDLVVRRSDEVFCATTILGHPIFRSEVAEAL